MLQLEEAVARILERVPPAQPETISLDAAQDRVLMQSIQSTVDLPPFDNSAMDGYATRAQDTTGATQQNPVLLRLAGTVAAGEVLSRPIEASCCARIFTGSALPAGADSVVMQEDTSVDPASPSQIQVRTSAQLWENVRLRGEDIRSGATVARAGESLSAGKLALLAAVGANTVQVARRPTVGLVATGSELDEPGQPLRPGHIYESNRAALASLVRACGGCPVSFPVVPDVMEPTVKAISDAFRRCDLVVTIGGASVGDLDFIKPALDHAGVRLEFWRVAIKPGRPFLFGQFGEKLLFGLPGNPVSALVTFLLMVRPAVLKFQGAASVSLPRFAGSLAEPLVNSGNRRHFVRVWLSSEGTVTMAGAQASHLLSSFAAANGLVDLAPNSSLGKGNRVEVLLWDPGRF